MRTFHPLVVVEYNLQTVNIIGFFALLYSNLLVCSMILEGTRWKNIENEKHYYDKESAHLMNWKQVRKTHCYT